MRCILAYTYKCLKKYDDALIYLKEAIVLKEKNPIALYIYGEILFRQNDYENAVNKLNTSKGYYKAKINNLFIMLGSSYFFNASYNDALHNFNIALQNNSNNYLCLKCCAYIYEIQANYSNSLDILKKVLNIN